MPANVTWMNAVSGFDLFISLSWPKGQSRGADSKIEKFSACVDSISLPSCAVLNVTKSPTFQLWNLLTSSS